MTVGNTGLNLQSDRTSVVARRIAGWSTSIRPCWNVARAESQPCEKEMEDLGRIGSKHSDVENAHLAAGKNLRMDARFAIALGDHAIALTNPLLALVLLLINHSVERMAAKTPSRLRDRGARRDCEVPRPPLELQRSAAV